MTMKAGLVRLLYGASTSAVPLAPADGVSNRGNVLVVFGSAFKPQHVAEPRVATVAVVNLIVEHRVTGSW